MAQLTMRPGIGCAVGSEGVGKRQSVRQEGGGNPASSIGISRPHKFVLPSQAQRHEQSARACQPVVRQEFVAGKYR